MFSGGSNVNKNKEFVGRAQNARQIRAEERKREQAAVKIQVQKYLVFENLTSFIPSYVRTRHQSFKVIIIGHALEVIC